MVLYTLATEQTSDEPHTFVLVEREQDDYPTRHLLEEQHNDIISGIECVPKSLFELLQSGWTDVGTRRIYVSVKLNKTL